MKHFVAGFLAVILAVNPVFAANANVQVDDTTGALWRPSAFSKYLVPSQTGNSGKYLTTNGTTASWATVIGGSGFVNATITNGDSPITAGSTGGNINFEGGGSVVVTANATTIIIASSANATAAGTWTANAVLVGAGGTSGVALSSTGNSGAPLLSGGANTPAYGALNLAGGTNIITGTLPVGNGGTGITALGTGVAAALGNAVFGTGNIVMTNPTQTDLAGGTALTLGVEYYDTLSANRTLTITGSTEGGHTMVMFNVTTASTLTVPSGYIIPGDAVATTTVPMNTGYHMIRFDRQNSKWLIAHTAVVATDGQLYVGNSTSGTVALVTPSGDWTMAASGAATLATVNSNVGTFGSVTAAPVITVNGKGLITAVSNNTITPAVGSITGLGTGVGAALAVNIGSAGGIVTNNSTDTLTEKTFDASASGNVLKMYSYLILTHPTVFGSSVTQQTTVTSPLYGQALFSNSADKANNYVEYICTVPPDIDTSVDLTGAFKFILGGADTNDHEYEISMISVANSGGYDAALGNAVSLTYTADGSGANKDVETAGAPDTLTGWKGNVTASQYWRIRVARDGDHANDTSTVDSYSGPLIIRYGISQ